MEKSLKELQDQLEKYMKENVFSDYLKKKFSSEFQMLSIYMETNLITSYKEAIGKEYLTYREFSGNGKSPKNIKRRYDAWYIELINGMLNSNAVTKKKKPDYNAVLPGNLGNYLYNFLNTYAKERRLSELTRNYYYSSLKCFCQKMDEDKIYNFEDLTAEYILEFVFLQKTKDHVASILRAVLADLYSKKIIDFRTANILSNVKTRTNQKLPSYYTPEEVMCIEKSIDRKYAMGKRDYAMILLATRLGLRSSDIRLLQFSNIDWDKNLIIIEQFKTKQPVELPLLNDVGEAIIDYIKHSRPKSFSKYIFLKATSPYLPLEGPALNAITKKYFIKSNVQFAKKKHGPHSLRHSLATNMLRKGAALPIISGTLGHSSSANTMKYVHLNVEELLKCTLEVPVVFKDFYIQ